MTRQLVPHHSSFDPKTAPGLLDFLAAAEPFDVGADTCAIEVLPASYRTSGAGKASASRAVPAARNPAGGRYAAWLLRQLGGPLTRAARLALRQPRLKQLALRILVRFPALYARAYRMLMQQAAAGNAAAAAKLPSDLSPRANALLRQLERVAVAPSTRTVTQAARRKLAFVSPLPPERTGVAVYALELLPALRAHFDIELVVKQTQWTLPAELADLPVRQADWFAEHAGEYDQILYQFGNSPFHAHMFDLLRQHPGVVVLHDFFLGAVLAYLQMSGTVPHAWTDALFHSHGYGALRASQDPALGAAAHKAWPCSLPVLDNATRMIVHSEYARHLASAWYGPATAGAIEVIPHPRAAAERVDRAAARSALGIPADAFLVCSFGFVAPNKLTHELLEAWLASSLNRDRSCMLVLVGANHDSPYGVAVTDLIRSAGAAQIRIAGWSDDAVYKQYLQAADIGVQLRTGAHGETSGAVLDCMNYGLPTIVNANGSMAALPIDAVWQLPDRFTVTELAAALDNLRHDPAQRLALGARALELLEQHYRPAQCARQYRDALDRAHATEAARKETLRVALATQPDTTADSLRALAASLARMPARPVQRQLLVDIGAIAPTGHLAPADRANAAAVARAQLLELLDQTIVGLRVEPVALHDEGGRFHYRYARNATGQLLGIDWPRQDEPVVDVAAGDVFYAPNAFAAGIHEAATAGLFADWRAGGVTINMLVQSVDMADGDVSARLRRVAAVSDRLLCMSDAIAQELEQALAPASGRGHRRDCTPLDIGKR